VLRKSGVIVSGAAESSELWRRASLGESDAERMPPTGPRLSAAEQSVLRSWIDAGAEIPEGFHPPEHWAWRVPVRPSVAGVVGGDLSDGSQVLDNLIRAGLSEAGLSFSPRAPAATLIRRLCLDLTGLPPEPGVVESFERDPSAAHYARLVERYLGSEQFGERWARHWLDLARYADSHGFQRDDLRDIWAWRDWVIRAMNADMPYDQFTIEQLAGDLLPGATESQRIATGFHRCTTVNVEAGSLPEETRAEQLIDRVNTTGAVWLGATLECAQCHDHKYDPFTQRDYYRLLAFFNSTAIEADRRDADQPSSIAFLGPTMDLSDVGRDQRRREVSERLSQLREEQRRLKAAVSVNVAGADVSLAGRLPVESVLRPSDFQSQGATDMWRLLEDGSILITGGDAPATDVYTVTVREFPADIRAIRLDALTHAELPGGGPGRGSGDRPNFVLHELSAEVESVGGAVQRVPFETAWADFSQQKWEASGAVDGNLKTGWAIAPQFGRDHFLVCVLGKPLSVGAGFGAGAVLRIRLEQQFGSARTLGRFRLTALSGAVPERPGKLRVDAEEQRLERAVAALERELAELQPATTLIMVEAGAPRETAIFERGDYRQRGAVVKPGVPEFLSAGAAAGGGAGSGGDVFSGSEMRTRLDLARWLVSRENPLAARAAVNRWWAEIFGEGLVATAEDFGVKGERPSHPELLDWLALELMDSGWSMKHVLRRIVLSETYQQSSVQTESGCRVDERNRLLWRGPAFRMDAEMVRDNQLFASGLLSLKQFGPPIRPPQPEGLWEKVGGAQYEYRVSEGEDLWRRGIYVVLKRSAMHPSLMTFDGSARLSCVVRRSRTNTPQQALALLNDPTSVAAARALAARVQDELPDGLDRVRLERAFRLCVSRGPSEAELRVLQELLSERRVAFAARPEDAAAIVGVGGGGAVDEIEQGSAVERAAWCSVATVLLNLHETVTKN
jgi:hypothetical protein